MINRVQEERYNGIGDRNLEGNSEETGSKGGNDWVVRIKGENAISYQESRISGRGMGRKIKELEERIDEIEKDLSKVQEKRYNGIRDRDMKVVVRIGSKEVKVTMVKGE